MKLPSSTYRLQFRDGMDFDRAAALAPYLADLGISHLYASPLLQAMPGSTHGYDVTDHGRLDESLGGREGFQRLSVALRTNSLGLVLDIVPNHMAASPENPWWYDLLRHGAESAYASHFDVDWTQPKLTLPILGRPYGDALAAGEFSLGHDRNGLTWRYFGHALPLDPSTWTLVFGEVPWGEPDNFARWRRDEGNEEWLLAALAGVAGDPEALHLIHEAQTWRLMHWRAARDALSYRRFFEVSGLVGVRVEEARVFDDVHRFLFELIDAGHIDGVRIDHVDGLADPAAYVDRLAGEMPRRLPIWVEKVLVDDERLPGGWPVAGTTGYEFACAAGRALTNAAAEAELDGGYRAFIGSDVDYAAMRREAKMGVLSRNLAAELAMLVRLARQAFAADPRNRDWGSDSLRRAIVALLAAMPVYRTYLASAPAGAGDHVVLDVASDTAREDPTVEDPLVVDALVRCLVEGSNNAAAELRTRFQQTSGALTAKAVEDTLLYRFNRLISANEVGSDPGKFSGAPDDFHRAMAERARRQPAGLSTTATHDTKHGEDARMRIAAISEAPEAWLAAVERCDNILRESGGIPLPDANMRWMFYQALLGSWPGAAEVDLGARLSAFVVKAAREAKLRTSWVKQARDYERALAGFAEGALSHGPFVGAFAAEATRFVRIGERKSLAQLAMKLTVPGIPDIYQGTELADLSLVDPDNRRPVDFARRRAAMTERDTGSEDFDACKLGLLTFGLKLRKEKPELFAGTYRPVAPPAGCHERTLAFAREAGGDLLFVAVDLSGGAGGEFPSPMQWTGVDGRLARTWPAAADPSAEPDIGAQLRAAGVSISLLETGEGAAA